MALLEVPGLLFKARFPSGNDLKAHIIPSKSKRIIVVNPTIILAKANTKTESAKTINRRMRKKIDPKPGNKSEWSTFTPGDMEDWPLLRQLYALLVDDQNKQCLFYGSTLQKSIRNTPPCNTIEAARRVGEKLVAACVDLDIQEISAYDRNGYARGEKMQAFEIAISQYGFLPR